MPSLVRKRESWPINKKTGKPVKKPHVAWLAQVPIGKKPNGTTRYLRKTFETRDAAVSWANEKKMERDSGGVVEPAKMTVWQYLDHWLKTAVKPSLRANTAESYRNVAENYLKPQLEDVRLEDLSPLHVQAAYAEIQKAGHSSRTVRYAHSVLHNALDQAVAWRMLRTNPAGAGIKLPKHTKKEIAPLAAEEAADFVLEARSHRLGPLFEVALVTGMRPGELLGLQWVDVDLDGGSIRVCRTLTQTAEGCTLNEPKTKRGRRAIPIPAETVATLRAWHATQASERMKAGELWKGEPRPRDGFVFTGALGRPLDQRNVVNRGFRPLLDRYRKAQLEARDLADAGEPVERIAETLGRAADRVRRWVEADRAVPNGVRMYDLRHTCATLMLLAGVNPKVVSERLGHASVVLTLDTYSHVLPNMQHDATERLAEVVYGERA